MSLATQPYRSSLIGASPDIFPSGINNTSKDNMAAKNDTASSARRWLDAQQQQINGQRDECQSFFDFEPQIGSASPFAPQYPALPEADLTPGWSTFAPQVPSPPHSAASPPPSWPPYHYQQPPVHNILTDIYPDTRVQYGQNTPPDDNFPQLFAPPEETQESDKKRKRSSTNSGSTHSDMKNNTPTKRSRKHGRSSNSSNGQALSSAEDVRRSKFLERNRVAASKCRQKKKEWTQNLENRARELQKENHNLRMMLDSMRDEMLFIKSEMLKHTTCGCEQIQGWVKTNGALMSTSPIIKTEQSPINSAPASRCGSVSTTGGGSSDQEPSLPGAEGVQRSKSPQSQSLESLLINQLVQDTGAHGAAKMLEAAA
ncbi:MAG: hypothetical protein Q9172_000630 [Xanthocarpia lactea]